MTRQTNCHRRARKQNRENNPMQRKEPIDGVVVLMPKIIGILLAASLAMAGSGAPARAQANPPRRRHRPRNSSALSQFFENEVTTGKLPGAVVLIQQHGRPVYLKSFGVRDVATKLPMTPDTIFAIHSMTKPITSVAAMMLIDEGKLALADPVSRYIPAFAAMKVGVESKPRTATRCLNSCRRSGR